MKRTKSRRVMDSLQLESQSKIHHQLMGIFLYYFFFLICFSFWKNSCLNEWFVTDKSIYKTIAGHQNILCVFFFHPFQTVNETRSSSFVLVRVIEFNKLLLHNFRQLDWIVKFSVFVSSYFFFFLSSKRGDQGSDFWNLFHLKMSCFSYTF